MAVALHKTDAVLLQANQLEKEKENLMKKVTLFACLLALTLSASAQSRQSVGSNTVPSNTHDGKPRNAAPGATKLPLNVGSQSADAAAKAAANARNVTPVAKIPTNVGSNVRSNTKK